MERLTALGSQRVAGLPMILRAGLANDEIVVLAEGLASESLDQAIASHPMGFDPTVASRMTGELASALAHLHANGLLHLDVRPGSIAFERGEQQAALIDWGHLVPLAEPNVPLAEPNQALSVLAGMGFDSLSYASPQRLAGEPPQASDDVFSLACVVYELFTGQHPFGRRSGLDASKLGLQPAPVRGLDQAANAVVVARACIASRRPRSDDARVGELSVATGVTSATDSTPRRIRARHRVRDRGRTLCCGRRSVLAESRASRRVEA